jgi:hypothetical protein
MKTVIPQKLLITLLVMVGMLTSGYSAAQTAAETPINNTATLTFSVGAASGLILESGPEDIVTPADSGNAVLGTSNGAATTFLVDRLIDLTVARIADISPDAAAGQTGIVLGFTVTNESNAPLSFELYSEVNFAGIVAADTNQLTSGAQINFTGPPAGFVAAYSDNDSSGTYVSATDTDTFVDELVAGATRNVYVVVDLPAGGTQDIDDYVFATLIARAAEPAGAGVLGSIILVDDNGYDADGLVTGTVNPDDPTAVDDVFADGTSDAYYNGSTVTITDPIRNGQFSASRIIEINAGMNLEKTAIAVWDNINLDSSPKAIPGAYVEYTLTIENLASSGGQSSTLTSVTDNIPGTVALDLGLLNAVGCTPSTSTDVDGVTVYDAPDTACSSQDSNSYGTTSIVKVIYNDVSAGTTHTGYFNTGGAELTFVDPLLTINLDDILTSTSTFTPAATANFATITNEGEIEAEDSVDIIFNVVVP